MQYELVLQMKALPIANQTHETDPSNIIISSLFLLRLPLENFNFKLAFVM